jgi:galactokinase
MSDQRRHVCAEFQRRFGRPPEWLAVAPGRVNLIGEHVDYCGGFVLPMAIERFTMVAAALRPADAGHVARVVSTAMGREACLPLRAAASPLAAEDAWARYVQGVIAGFHERGADVPAFDALIDSTVPLGGGLSSSASLEVAMATLLAALSATEMKPLDLARLCQRAEHDYAGVPCGMMDQCASTLCVEGHLLLLDCRSLEATPVAFTRDDLLVLVANTNVRHSLGDGEYARRRSDCEAAARMLDVPLLRDATLADVMAARERLGPRAFARARHVVTEIERTQRAVAAIGAGNWAEVGSLMAASHASLRDDYEVSCRELDLLVELAASEPGVVGARMTGGGFGGCTVTLVEADRAAGVMDRMARGYRDCAGRECTMFTTRPAAGAMAQRLG